MALPQTSLGELTVLPETSWIQGVLLLTEWEGGERKRGRGEGRGMDGERRECIKAVGGGGKRPFKRAYRYFFFPTSSPAYTDVFCIAVTESLKTAAHDRCCGRYDLTGGRWWVCRDVIYSAAISNIAPQKEGRQVSSSQHCTQRRLISF